MKVRNIRKILIAAIAVLASVLLVLFAGAQPIVFAYAAEFTAYDKTKIEDDLRSVDTTFYPKDENAKHRLMDETGFMEYGYSQSSFIADNYYGIYLYVYNPTEREVSTRAGANVVNMAVEYGEDGEPTKYENVPITYLDCTSNHRFYKFKVTDSADVYARALAYSKAHEGKRRYDIGSIQLWFVGDANATDSFVGSDGISYTYYCTGYAEGCGANGNDASTLAIERKKLETISLDIHSTWFRTDFTENYFTATTLSSVYFAVPRRFLDDYGNLQIIKAEWYEYKTNWIFVTDDETVYHNLNPHLGETLPGTESSYWGTQYYNKAIPFECYHYIGPSDKGGVGLGYNTNSSSAPISRLDWLIRTEDILNTVSSNEVMDYANSYPIYAGDEVFQLGEKRLNANLFSEEIDEGHTRGYNVREFDTRNKEDWIDLKIKDITTGWNAFLSAWRLDDKFKTYLEAKDVLPIEEITGEKLKGSYIDVSERILVDTTEVKSLKDYQTKAENEGNAVFILRFSTSKYNSLEMEFHANGDIWGDLTGRVPKFYAAKDTVYLDFDIIHLGFVKGDEVTIIPVVASPIDIYPALQPPPSLIVSRLKELMWWLIGIAGTSAVAAIIAGLVQKNGKGGAAQ